MNTRISPEDVLVRAQDTPNPYAIKFIVNHSLKNAGKATFNKPEECQHLPLAESILNILGVTQIYFFENTVTVSHDGSVPTEDLKEYVEAVIKTRLPIHDADFVVEEDEKQISEEIVDRSQLPQEMQLIESILDRTIRPGLQADGGDIDLISFEDNEVKILYQGACGGCPSAMFGTLEAIQGILQAELGNESIIVIPV